MSDFLILKNPYDTDLVISVRAKQLCAQVESVIDWEYGTFTVSDETIGTSFTNLTLQFYSYGNTFATIVDFVLLTCDGDIQGKLYKILHQHNFGTLIN